jgi:hypothetical protein
VLISCFCDGIINHLQISIENKNKHIIEGLIDLQKKILCLFGQTVANLYQIDYLG